MKAQLLFYLFLISFLFVTKLPAQELQTDANTTLLLHFNNNTNGAAGETPNTSQNISYQAGVHQEGVALNSGNNLSFAAANNISSTEGTLEFWLQPFWNGNDGQSYTFLQ